jgi:hypothetical protein
LVFCGWRVANYVIQLVYPTYASGALKMDQPYNCGKKTS